MTAHDMTLPTLDDTTAIPDGEHPELDLEAVLRDEHARISELLARAQTAGVSTSTYGLDALDVAMSEFAAHGRAEEEAMYHSVRAVPGFGDEMVEESIAQHRRMEALYELVRSLGHDRAGERVNELVELFTAHVTTEEERILPQMRAFHGDQAMRDLGVKFVMAKARISSREPVAT